MKIISRYLPRGIAMYFIILVSILAACTPVAAPTMPVDNGGQATQAGLTEDELVIEENANVQGVHVNLMESFPLQVSVTISGMLQDSCTSIHGTQVKPDLEKGIFDITILTERPKNAACIQVLTPFETTVPLDVLGLPAGVYIVNVYDRSASFMFEQDNVLPD